MSHELYVLSVCVTCCGQQFPCQLQGTGAMCVPRVVCVTECLCCDLWMIHQCLVPLEHLFCAYLITIIN